MSEEFIKREYYPIRFNQDKIIISEFLEKNNLRYEENIEYSFGLLDCDENLIACGCAAGNILKCFAVEKKYQGANCIGIILSNLIANRFENGIIDLFIYTKNENIKFFVNNGFYLIEQSNRVSILENRKNGIKEYLNNIPFLNFNNNGAIVMNANPFTLGHLNLIHYAKKNCDGLYIFVVEEDASLFPFRDRIKIIKETVSDENIVIIGSGKYIISNKTFPSYFLKDNNSSSLEQAIIDAKIFSNIISPRLNIKKRFVGKEPFDKLTNEYNNILKKYNNIIEIPRFCNKNNEIISASKVREKLLKEGAGSWLLDYVPLTTYRYLRERDIKNGN